jgi:hypothetical protein
MSKGNREEYDRLWSMQSNKVCTVVCMHEKKVICTIHPVSYVPGIDGFSRLSILHCPFGFL